MQAFHPSRRFNVIISIALYCLLMMSRHLSADEIPNDFEDQFNERIKSVVIVKLFVELEIERAPLIRQGVVIDNEGRIILVGLPVTSPKQFKDFKVYLPGDATKSYSANYLGRDYLNDTHFIQVEESLREKLKPVTEYKHRSLKRGEFLWGIAIMPETENFSPYFLDARLSILQKLPLEFGFTLPGLATPGALVFTADGSLAGWAQHDIIQELFLFIQNTWIPAAVQRKDESGSFLCAEPFLEQIKRIPESVEGQKEPWAGIAGLQPLDKDVAELLGLKDQGAVVVSDIVEESPAAKAGLKSKDIIIKFDNEILPSYKPDSVVIEYMLRKIKLCKIGEKKQFTIIRGEDQKEVTVEFGENPTPYIDAKWEYFPRLGFSIREFLVNDAIQLRTLKQENPGVITRFVKANSPISTAGLQQGDWIKEVDGVSILNYPAAVEKLKSMNDSESKNDFVLLVSRNNETKVLRVKLN
jgi:serine protease Do